MKPTKQIFPALLAVVIPFVLVAYRLVPNSPTWMGFETKYFPDWATAVWTSGTFLASAVLLVYSKKWNFFLVLVLLQIAFASFWYFLRSVLRESSMVAGSNTLVVVGVCLLVLSVIMLIRQKRQPTWQERYQESEDKLQNLKGQISKLNRYEVASLMSYFVNMDRMADLMEKHEDLDRWRKILKEDAARAAADHQQAYQHLDDLTANF